MHDISFQSLINTLDLFSTGVAIVNQEGRFLFWNSGAALITGHTADKVVGQTFDQALTMVDIFGKKITFSLFLEMHQLRGNSASLEVWIENQEGILSHVRLYSARLTDGEGTHQGFAMILHDVIIEEVLGDALAKVSEQAHIDALTKLFNKDTLIEDLQTHIENVKRAKYLVGVVFMDIDRFKSINDRFGHITGDSVLSLFGKLILGSIRKGERAYRFGGDEFVVVLLIDSQEDLLRFTQRFERALYETKFPVTLDVTVGFWVVLGTDTAHSALDKADKKMYEKKLEKKRLETPRP